MAIRQLQVRHGMHRQPRKESVQMCRLLSKATRNAAALLVSVCMLSNVATAQEVRPASAAGLSRPAPLDSTVLSPELENLLKEWEVRSGRIKNMRGDFHRYQYNSIYGSAKSAKGKYWFQDPDKARMDFEPDPAARDGATTKRSDIVYNLIADERRVWICDGEQILNIDPIKKEYDRAEILPAYRGKKIADGPLPFLFGMEASKLKERYVLQLGKMHNPEKLIHIVAFPKTAIEQREYRSAEVLLNPKTFLPQAIQLLAPTEDQVTVYLFQSQEEFNFTASIVSPFKVNLNGFSLLTDTTDTSRFEREAKVNDGIRLR